MYNAVRADNMWPLTYCFEKYGVRLIISYMNFFIILCFNLTYILCFLFSMYDEAMVKSVIIKTYPTQKGFETHFE